MNIKLKKPNNATNYVNIMAYSSENPTGNIECVINTSCGGGAADMVCGCNGGSESGSNNTNFGCVMNEDFTNETNYPLTNFGCTNTGSLPQGSNVVNHGCQ